VTGRHPTFDFDLFGPVTRAESDASWAEPREQSPVAWSDRHGGFWVISGYDVDAVVEYPNWASVGGWAKLPATFTPGPRVGSSS
jgi:hypothetical protein